MFMRFLIHRKPHDGQTQCPRCGSPAVHRCASRNGFDRLKKRVTGRRLHHCPDCRWHGWLRRADVAHAPQPSFSIELEPPDLTAIDTALSETFSKK